MSQVRNTHPGQVADFGVLHQSPHQKQQHQQYNHTVKNSFQTSHSSNNFFRLLFATSITLSLTLLSDPESAMLVSRKCAIHGIEPNTRRVRSLLRWRGRCRRCRRCSGCRGSRCRRRRCRRRGRHRRRGGDRWSCWTAAVINQSDVTRPQTVHGIFLGTDEARFLTGCSCLVIERQQRVTGVQTGRDDVLTLSDTR